MLHFFYKYIHYFYLPAQIHETILETTATITSESLKTFFLNHDFDTEEMKISTEKISDFLYRITIKFRKENKKNNFLKFMLPYKEVFPPWKVFPNMFMGSPRWNQGIQEDYGLKNWIPYWKGLSFEEKNIYLEKYSCPAEWKDWLADNKSNF